MNKRMLHRAVALIAVVLGWACAVSARAEESSVLNDIRFGERAGEVTRVVFDLEGAPDYSIFTLAGDGADRLVIDFDRLTFAVRQAGELGGRGDGRGRVARYRYAHNSTDASRVVLDLKQPVAVSEAFVIEPSGATAHHRLVVDLAPVDRATFAATAGFIADSLGFAKPADVRVSSNKIVVLDPGHGGRDPGAIGAAGTYEKTVTLAYSNQLKRVLQARGGYEVHMTRDEDSYVEHEDRIRIARRAGADLFVSIHADGHRNRSIRGASVYTLAESATNRFASEMRAKGEPVFEFDSGEHSQAVDDILLALAQRETQNQSGVFAETVIEKINGVMPLLNNTHRQANYYVLLAPDVPAVLLELGFITNRQDEKALIDPSKRDEMVAAIANAVDMYFVRRGLRHARAD